MEYGTPIHNNAFMKHVGYIENNCDKEYFSPNNIQKISNKITELLMGVDEYNRKIIVPDSTISNIMSSVLDNYMPEIGDIHTRYIIQNKYVNKINKLNDQVINIIVTNTKNEIEIAINNKKLTIWTTLLGDFNKHGLNSHSKIKLREKRPQPMLFNMNY